jgi:hypothetical protein
VQIIDKCGFLPKARYAAQPPGWQYEYNARGQVTQAARYRGTQPPPAGSAIATQRLAYVYDALGNRVEAVQGSGADAIVTGYTADGLNQYDAITHARQVELTGQAAPGAVVGVEADGIALS